jgi:hypothetical protein
MSHFYGTIQGTRGEATRCGDSRSGLITQAASWKGAIEVRLFNLNGEDYYEVTQIPWMGSGISKRIASGLIGKEPTPLGFREAA